MNNDRDDALAAGEARQRPSELDGASRSRRSFLKGVSVVGVAAALSPATVEAAAAKTAEDGGAPPSAAARGLVPVTLKVNGKRREADIDPRASLLDALRESLDLTGTKKGCDHGQCGACTVHIDGRRALSCLSLALSCQGHEITTIEGLGTPEKMHPMQAAFVECDGYQCGYCTSGQIMSATALAKEQIGPDDADVKEAMSGNICRCGAYQNIVAAIQKGRGGK